MAAECTQEAILDFLREKEGKVKNTDLIEHFKAVFPKEPEERAAVRQTFKNYVDNIAFVKTETGVKYVCLKKKFRSSEREQQSPSESPNVPQGLHDRYPTGALRAHSGQVRDAAEEPALPRAAGAELQQQIPPGSGYGNDSQVRVPHVFPSPPTTPDKADDNSEIVCVVEEVDSSSEDMGNRGSSQRQRRESKKEQPDIPEITVIEASPLPAEGSLFALSGPVQTGSTGQVGPHTAAAGLDPRDRQVETESEREAEWVNAVTRRQNSKGSQHRSRQPNSDEGEEEEFDVHSLCGSEDTSKGSRQHFIEVMMNSSPQLRRSMVLRSSVYLPSRSDSGDSVSLVSSHLEDDRTSVTLDPVEHEWMMCASDGEWGSLHRLLATEPGLVLRKDFVTGFTCLHWAAKHGKPELIALIINFAKQNHVSISVDIRSNTGYTPLHIAAMHNHMEVVKLLVGAYNADVEIRDYSGRKACQYLTDNVSMDIRDIIGAYERSDSENADRGDRGPSRFSKVFQSNLRPLRLLHPNDCDSVDGESRPKEKLVRRKSSLSKMKPKLQKLRERTSQIVHSTTLFDTEAQEGSLRESRRGSFRSRPKTHFFG